MDNKSLNTVTNYYKFQSKIYDLTRWTFLFGRKRMIQESVKGLSKDANILELGSGTGHNLKMLNDLGYSNLNGLDLSEEMIGIASKKIPQAKFSKQLYEADSYKTDSFDLIIMSYFLTLNFEKKPLLENAKRHLKNGGRIAIVDFHKTNLKMYDNFMKNSHIIIEESVLDDCEEFFKTHKKHIGSGILNIWKWFLFVGENLK